MRAGRRRAQAALPLDRGAPLSLSVTDDALLPLLSGVELLCLDAGNTVIFLEHARLARLAATHGHALSVDALVVAEGDAKRLAETGGLLDLAWQGAGEPGALGWGRMVGTLYSRAGVPAGALVPLVEAAWRSHVDYNLWSKVPIGLGDAVEAFRATGGRVAIVSNSEGMLASLFAKLGIAQHFDLVADSGLLGVEKPDPRIFEHVLRELSVPPTAALHLGDVFATDVLGARAAGVRVALIDPFDHYAGRHDDVPRVSGVASVARALATRRAGAAGHTEEERQEA